MFISEEFKNLLEKYLIKVLIPKQDLMDVRPFVSSVLLEITSSELEELPSKLDDLTRAFPEIGNESRKVYDHILKLLNIFQNEPAKITDHVESYLDNQEVHSSDDGEDHRRIRRSPTEEDYQLNSSKYKKRSESESPPANKRYENENPHERLEPRRSPTDKNGKAQASASYPGKSSAAPPTSVPPSSTLSHSKFSAPASQSKSYDKNYYHLQYSPKGYYKHNYGYEKAPPPLYGYERSYYSGYDRSHKENYSRIESKDRSERNINEKIGSTTSVGGIGANSGLSKGAGNNYVGKSDDMHEYSYKSSDGHQEKSDDRLSHSHQAPPSSSSSNWESNGNYRQKVYFRGPPRHISYGAPGARQPVLFLSKVPQHLNDIQNLDGHFRKFGKVINIETRPRGHALIKFEKTVAAEAALHSGVPICEDPNILITWYSSEMDNFGARLAHYTNAPGIVVPPIMPPPPTVRYYDTHYRAPDYYREGNRNRPTSEGKKQ